MPAKMPAALDELLISFRLAVALDWLLWTSSGRPCNSAIARFHVMLSCGLCFGGFDLGIGMREDVCYEISKGCVIECKNNTEYCIREKD